MCVSRLHGPSQKLPHHTSQTDEHPEQAEREVSGYGGLLERGMNQVLRQQASEPELDLNPAQTTFTDIVLVKVGSSPLGLMGCHLAVYAESTKTIYFGGPDNELTISRYYTFDIIIQS
jgi:hypothetical protein